MKKVNIQHIESCLVAFRNSNNSGEKTEHIFVYMYFFCFICPQRLECYLDMKKISREKKHFMLMTCTFVHAHKHTHTCPQS